MIIDKPIREPGYGDVVSTLSYSLDGGSTWTVIYTTEESRAKQYDSIPLPANQDLSKVRVRATCMVNDGQAISVEQDIYEVRIDYTT